MPPPSRATWTWHRRLGLCLLLPLAWWTLTALVFALRPIEEVRGRTWSTGKVPEAAPLDPSLSLPVGLFAGATAVAVRRVEGRQVAAVERGEAEPELLDLEAGRPLGAAIPLEWALAAAQRDFTGAFDPEVIWRSPGCGGAPAPPADQPFWSLRRRA